MDRMIHILREFNFTESEAKVYLSLLQHGPCTGYESSKLSGVPRSKIYNILEGLSKRGILITSSEEKSVLYQAIPVSQLSASIKVSVEQSLEELKSELQNLSQPFASERIWHLYDYKSVLLRCRELVEHAAESVLLQIWVEDMEAELAGLLNHKRQELGKVLVVLYDAKEQYRTTLQQFYKHGFEQDKLVDFGHRWLTLTVDGKEMIHASIQDSRAAEAIYTQNPNMVFFAKEYIIHDAYCLRLIERLGKQVQTEFGQGMAGIRNIFDY